jgi:hypothetical protein
MRGETAPIMHGSLKVESEMGKGGTIVSVDVPFEASE